MGLDVVELGADAADLAEQEGTVRGDAGVVGCDGGDPASRHESTLAVIKCKDNARRSA
ncbi:hypothetical protein GCM10009528_35560 [Kineococcus aurantiacus]